MNALPVKPASQLCAQGPQTQWLIEELWGDQAVGILGGEPKSCKSFLALDMAVSVASGRSCLRRFPVRRPGSVLLFPAEDSLAVVGQRLEGICRAAQLSLDGLPIEVITAPTLRLDQPKDCHRLANTVESLKPVLLILDPLIRLHRVDENDASQIAALLSFLRHLQRRFHLAVVLVHHARKNSNGARPGQALRGSSELHGWGDSNLYMRRRGDKLTLSTEHRAAPSKDHLPLELSQEGSALSLSLLSDQKTSAPVSEKNSPLQRVQKTLAQLDHPVPLQQLRKLCGMRTASVCSALSELSDQGILNHDCKGYQLKPQSLSLCLPLEHQGNRNGKPNS